MHYFYITVSSLFKMFSFLIMFLYFVFTYAKKNKIIMLKSKNISIPIANVHKAALHKRNIKYINKLIERRKQLWEKNLEVIIYHRREVAQVQSIIDAVK